MRKMRTGRTFNRRMVRINMTADEVRLTDFQSYANNHDSLTRSITTNRVWHVP